MSSQTSQNKNVGMSSSCAEALFSPCSAVPFALSAFLFAIRARASLLVVLLLGTGLQSSVISGQRRGCGGLGVVGCEVRGEGVGCARGLAAWGDERLRALEGEGAVYSSSMSKGVILDALGRGLEGFDAGGRAGLAKDDAAGLETGGRFDCAFGFAMGAVGFDADAVAAGLAFGRCSASRSSLSVSEGTLLDSRGCTVVDAGLFSLRRSEETSSSLKSPWDANTSLMACFCLISCAFAFALKAPSAERSAPATTGLARATSFFFASIVSFSRSYSAICRCFVNSFAVSRNSSSTIIHSSSRRSNFETPLRMGSKCGLA